MALLTTEIRPLNGLPLPQTRSDAATLLLGPVLKFKPTIWDNRKRVLDIDLKSLAAFMADRPNFEARGRKKLEVSFRWDKVLRDHAPMMGRLSTIIDSKAVEAEVLLQAAIETVALLHAPIGLLDQRGDHSFRLRAEHHRTRYQEGATGADRVFGYFRGFSGIGWRTILGPHFVQHFGVDALSSLPESLSRQVAEDVWLLSPCPDPDDWRADRWCAGEAQIIEALGKESFFDPQTEALPTRVPVLPAMLPIPVAIIRRVTPPAGLPDAAEPDVWEYHNGYPAP